MHTNMKLKHNDSAIGLMTSKASTNHKALFPLNQIVIVISNLYSVQKVNSREPVYSQALSQNIIDRRGSRSRSKNRVRQVRQSETKMDGV